MTRADKARWMMLFALIATISSALAGSAIGVIAGSLYVFVSVAATFESMITRWLDGAEDNKEEEVHEIKSRSGRAA